MTNLITAGLMLLSLSAVSQPERASSGGKLKQQIVKKLAGSSGEFAVAFKDLQNGETLLINAHEKFHAASTMKTPVLVECYRQASIGKFDLTDSILIQNKFKSIVDSSYYSLDSTNDSETDLYKQEGRKVAIEDILYRMITKSSNLATNTVIGLVGAQNVNITMRTYGISGINVLRGVEDGKAFEKGLNNTVTASSLMMLFEKIARHETVSESASRDMINILLDQKFNEIIPAQLPKEVRVAHKTGSINGVQHDSGIVFLPDGRKYVLVLLSKNLKDQDAGVRVLAEVSKMVYDHIK